MESLIANIVDIEARTIFHGRLTVHEGIIENIEALGRPQAGLPFIIPGFIDAHVHIESSMLVPSEFARLAVVHGTVATVSDPHEIANVCGVQGVQYMIDNGRTVPFKFYFGAPSCVPATEFETAGATLDAGSVDELLQKNEIYYLSEMMNFPGVLHNDPGVLAKIAAAKKYGKPVDGHAPGLRGEEAKRYAEAGISTDHECVTAEEAADKLRYGMKILIREGSAAKNFDALIPLLHDHEDDMMFCSDDKHPDSLVKGHINELCRRAVAKNIDVFRVLKAACINPVKHYRLGVGQLKKGDAADFIVVKDLAGFEVLATYISGIKVAENGRSAIDPVKISRINHFHCSPRRSADFKLPVSSFRGEVIEALDGQLITNKLPLRPLVDKDGYTSDVQNDILKIVVVNRYRDAPAAVGFVKNFNLKRGAIASSVAHDCHNIIAVGVDDESICKAVNMIIASQGGISTADHKDPSYDRLLPLPVAGLMSDADGYTVASSYTETDKLAKKMGSALSAPFMTLSFMALLVIPHIKLSDKGLFDGDAFALL